MSIEPIGLLTIAIGLLCLQLGYLATATTLIVATLFGAAAAILIGSANIQPAHLFLAFLAATTLTRGHERASAINAIVFPMPGFWLMCLVIYGVSTGFLMPRLMQGSMQIFPVGTSEYTTTASTIPLGPVSGNFTQGLYLVADLLCFTMIVAIASTRAGFAAVTSAVIVYSVGNALFALVDLATYASGTQWLMDFMRNAQYSLHIEEEISGLKRIVGSFPEASTFARSTLGILSFTGTLWLCGRRPVLTGALALISLALVILSTSAAGVAGTLPVLLILYVTGLSRSGFHPSRPYSSAVALCAPLLVIAVFLAIQFSDDAAEPIRRYIDAVIFSKSDSSSGIQRGAWNTLGLQNFFDSYGIGVGLGTVRTSSLPVALLSNVGVPGTIFYVLFVLSALGRSRGTPRSAWADVRLAARNACLGLTIGDTLVATTLEQGLLFYVLAGIACAEPERDAADFPQKL